MLKGYDVSHWQTVTPTNCDFLIAKATEGRTTKDRYFKKHLANAKANHVDLVGAYHFARTNQNVEDNVLNFLDVVTRRDEFGKNMILALDIEGIDARRSNAVSWCQDFCDMVYGQTGIKPLIYTQSSLTNKFGVLAKHDYGLWVAHWNTKLKEPVYKKWPVWALWQYSNGKGKLDHNYFNGDKTQYLKYCEKVGI